MYEVQFESADTDQVLNDFAVLGIQGTIEAGSIIARYSDWRSAEKLRTYLETYHCSITEGVIRTLKVNGWEDLITRAHIAA